MIDDSYESNPGDFLFGVGRHDASELLTISGCETQGKDCAEMIRADIARVAFLNLLFDAELIWRLFLPWGTRTGIVHAACSAAALLETVAARHGFLNITEYLERVAELRWRSSDPLFLSSPFVSLLYADSVPFVAANPLAGQSHQISHEFVQIE